MSAAVQPPVDMSVREFLRWEPGDGRRYQLVNGEPRAMAPPSTVHAYLQAELGSLIRNHLRARGQECDVLTGAGVVPRLLSDINVRVPDLAVTCSQVMPGQPTVPEPVLLIEILSPGNRADTWANVTAYTTIPSVREIVVLHSTRVAADILRRDARGEWPGKPERIQDGELALTSIDFGVPLMTLYARAGLGG